MLNWLHGIWKKVTGAIYFLSNFGIFNALKLFLGVAIKGCYPKVSDINGFPIIHAGSEIKFRQLLEVDLVNFDIREDDIFVVAYPKSGHHWAYDFINMLVTGNLELDNKIKETLFLEVYAGFEVGFDKLQTLPSPRVIYTHWPSCVLPSKLLQGKGKIVRLIRNPKDVYVSAFYHYNQMVVERGTGARDLQWNEFIEGAMDMIEGEVDPVLETKPFIGRGQDWFRYELDAEEKMNNLENAVVLYYEDLKDNMVAQLKQLSTFLGKEYCVDFYEQIAEMTSLQSVKKNKDLRMHDAFYKKGGLYRKGIIGDWKSHFTVAQNIRFDAITLKKMKNCPIMHKIRYEAVHM